MSPVQYPLTQPAMPVETAHHAVHFYENEADLAATVGDYLAEAISGGSGALVIATEAHRRAFVAELEARTVEFEGSLVMLDARQTLDSFMPAGALDPEAFHRVVGGLLAESAGRPIAAYGEMVALLWDEGNVVGAIELEKLWNELATEYEFSLLCAYPSASVSDPGQAEALHQVCGLHTSVSGARHSHREQTRQFHPEPGAPAAARRFAEALRSRVQNGSVLEDAELVTSELVTNAVLHARTPCTLSVCLDDSVVKISVRDEASTQPRPFEPPPTAISGRGLMLVDLLADAWGTEPGERGKTVWAEIRPGR